MKLKVKRKNTKINLIFIIIIFLLISVSYLLNLFSDKALPIFMNYSQLEVKRIATLVINNSLMNEVGTNITFDSLFITKEDNNGKIISMDINSSEVNRLLMNTNKVLEQNFKYLETGEIDKLKTNIDIKSNKVGVIYELPSGIIFNNIFLNNLFPKIPVRLNLVGTIFSKLITDIESYGINNAILKVNVYVSAEVKVILPFKSENIMIDTSIPLIIKIIEGDIPSYYFENK